MSNETDDYRQLAKVCMNERYWPYYVASILASFFGGLIFILTYRAFRKIIACLSKQRQIARVNQGDWHPRSSNVFLDVPTSTSQHSGLNVTAALRQPPSMKHRLSSGRIAICLT
ncbi:unnamed protein product [Mesocestoides corti]|uniref:Uncharacterized protein n=1 Tax=Mesocestoides corti TaxID=53468 RepID=A0A0R3UB43_MESCO|nr:unnamed protein product [Mesocestoides corti]